MELQDIHGQLKHTTEDIIEVATTFYTDLFSTKNTDEKATQQLLRNVHKKLSHEDMTTLDRLITLGKLEEAFFKLRLHAFFFISTTPISTASLKFGQKISTTQAPAPV